MITANELEYRFPKIPWRVPLKVERMDGVTRYVCRYCVAQRGLKAEELEHQFTNATDVVEHIRKEHPSLP